MEHKIELTYGYKDKYGVTHKHVTFGKRLTVGDLMKLDNDPRCQLPTQYSDIVNSRIITKFGDLPIPPPLDILLSLNRIDREDINAGVVQFLSSGTGDLPDDKYPNEPSCSIVFGFEHDGSKYTEIEMNRLPTGHDEVEADSNNLRGVMRECFMIGKRITKISTGIGSSLDGPIDLEKFKTLDSVDLNLLRIGALKADLFFRFEGEGTEKNGAGESGSDPVENNENVGSGDLINAGKKDGNVPANPVGTI